MFTCGCQEKCLTGIAVQREIDDEVSVAPFVSVLRTEKMTCQEEEEIIKYLSNLVVSDPDCRGRFCQQPGEHHHESDDDEGVEESVPGGQLYHGAACQVSQSQI